MIKAGTIKKGHELLTAYEALSRLFDIRYKLTQVIIKGHYTPHTEAPFEVNISIPQDFLNLTIQHLLKRIELELDLLGIRTKEDD